MKKQKDMVKQLEMRMKLRALKVVVVFTLFAVVSLTCIAGIYVQCLYR